jgi:hypothetical protein
MVANEQAWLRKRKFKPVVLCRRLPNNALKGTRREAASCFAGIPAARPLARAFGTCGTRLSVQATYGATRLTNSWFAGELRGLGAHAPPDAPDVAPSIMKAARIPQKLQPWFDARKKYRLTHAQVQMARELGLNPKKFGGLANHRQEPWKAPLPDFIEEIYLKRFGVERPAEVVSLEDLVARDQAKKARKREMKRHQLAQGGEHSAKQEEP